MSPGCSTGSPSISYSASRPVVTTFPPPIARAVSLSRSGPGDANPHLTGSRDIDRPVVETSVMQPSEIALIFDHLYWVRDRILDAAAADGVTWPGDAPGDLLGLRATLVHELDVEWSWRRRLTSADPTEFPAEDVELVPGDFPSVASIRERWTGDEMEMRAWLGSLSAKALDGPCAAEQTRSHPLWWHLQHIYTHALQQLSNAAWMLSADGSSPGDLDFLGFVEARERDAA